MTLRNICLYTYISTVIALGVSLVGCVGGYTSESDVGVIHLHANTLPESELATLRESLEEEGFTVKLRGNPSPFEENTLIYQPSVGFGYQLEKVRLALGNTEFSADDLYLQQAKNHHYTTGHLGLYIRSEHSEVPSEEEALPEVPLNLPDMEFSSHDCEETYFLEFFHGGEVKVFDLQDDAPLVTLPWSNTDEKVSLISDERAYRYKRSLSTSREGSEVVFSVTLTPMDEYNSFYGCQYRGRSSAHVMNRS